VLDARVQALRERGEDPFARLQIPAATMLLKQGFGRLIRARSDRGAVLVLDGRLQGKGYGKRMIAALPPATRIAHLDELREFFQT
ncbi:MAG: helicase C-terminal domain-containing protein, partial [Candidatus Baltobacteraceae bacterium]